MKLSVCIPTYNRVEELINLIDSIPKRIPIFVSDNGSYLKDVSFGGNVYVSSTTEVIAPLENWNRAILLSSSDYVFIVSDDDIFYPDAFDVVEETLNAHRDLDMYIWGCDNVDENYNLISNADYISDEYKIFSNGEAFRYFPYSVPFRFPSICLKKKLLTKMNLFNTEMYVTASDSELLQKVMITSNCYIANKPIAGYRIWPKSSTNLTNTSIRWFDELDIWTNNIKGFAKDNEKEYLIPRDYREKIMYQNIRSAISTMKENARSRKEQLHFLIDIVKDGYSRNIFHILKSIAVILFKK
ncbi:glycosyltransferase family 2 protein [Vibrio cholerae]|uniref:glycosyltransferase family 2 protein n=1 Tax=Vibrio cholerae TaxID=666 RepID=UPI0018F08B9A|nr:glycosyltransferase family 2 protein [Vibrio cholerae]MBJ6879702.1 glycosyltransferase family 2 protein [Vibrio cholerae]MBJ6883407.1 glycosyltransferase family 2 protein [Vibrio cholerae]MBJ6890766.1 glycosyltransferase family 2 protein [Vibrio cholerae]